MTDLSPEVLQTFLGAVMAWREKKDYKQRVAEERAYAEQKAAEDRERAIEEGKAAAGLYGFMGEGLGQTNIPDTSPTFEDLYRGQHGEGTFDRMRREATTPVQFAEPGNQYLPLAAAPQNKIPSISPVPLGPSEQAPAYELPAVTSPTTSVPLGRGFVGPTGNELPYVPLTPEQSGAGMMTPLSTSPLPDDIFSYRTPYTLKDMPTILGSPEFKNYIEKGGDVDAAINYAEKFLKTNEETEKEKAKVKQLEKIDPNLAKIYEMGYEVSGDTLYGKLNPDKSLDALQSLYNQEPMPAGPSAIRPSATSLPPGGEALQGTPYFESPGDIINHLKNQGYDDDVINKVLGMQNLPISREMTLEEQIDLAQKEADYGKTLAETEGIALKNLGIYPPGRSEPKPYEGSRLGTYVKELGLDSAETLIKMAGETVDIGEMIEVTTKTIRETIVTDANYNEVVQPLETISTTQRPANKREPKYQGDYWDEIRSKISTGGMGETEGLLTSGTEGEGEYFGLTKQEYKDEVVSRITDYLRAGWPATTNAELDKIKEMAIADLKRDLGVSANPNQAPGGGQETNRGGFDRSRMDKESIKAVAKGQLAKFGWDESEWEALEKLVNGESSWNPKAKNPTSTAYGLFQFLNKTWGNYGFEKTDDPIGQIEAGLTYIQKRYGSPSKALAFWKKQSPHWY